MSSQGFEADRSSAQRWDATSINLGRLPAAASDEHYQLHLAAVEFEMSSPIIIESKDDILSQKHWLGKVEPFEHQIKNLITFCRRAPVALIADDVGLGKTISAGLILNELQTRKRVRRALILCPKVMLEQWQEELDSKFGMTKVAIGVGQDLTQWLRQPIPVVVTTYESARDRMAEIRQAGFDMLILDEAHKLRNLFGTKEPPKLAVAIHEALEKRTFRYVLMLTATPVQNRLWDIYSVLQCLAVAKGHQNPLGAPSAFASRYVVNAAARQLHPGRKDEFRRKVQDYMVRTSRRTAGLSFPERRLQTVACKPQADEVKLGRMVGAAMAGLNPLTRVSIAEAQLSSPRALLAQLRNMVKNGTVTQATLDVLTKPIEASGRGCKLDRVMTICRELRAENPTRWRVLVFTRRKETLAMIAEALAAEGWSVGTIQGGDAAQNRRAIQGFRQDPPANHVIVSTDAGAVGLNLQSGNVIINYDLPWNPMVLEQRIGRVQRLGSLFQHVVVWNLSVQGSIEDLIVGRLLEKLHAVADTLGDIESVLEASSYGDNETFEKELKTLVTQALMGMDVSEALKKAQDSIDRARKIYEQERQSVEENLGTLDAMHSAGPSAPKLKPKAPRLDVPTFCRKAFAADGGELAELPRAQVRVVMPGRASWVAVFDGEDPDLVAGFAQFGGGHVMLYEEGSPLFERLTGEWRKRHAHRVLNRVEESRLALSPMLRSWAEGLGVDATLVDAKVLQERSWFRGEVLVRATAAVAHDRYEKLCVAGIKQPEHREMVAPAGEVEVPAEVHAASLAPGVTPAVRLAVEADDDVREFVKFYDARREEEVQRAAGGKAGQREIANRFETTLSAEAVGANGCRYASMEVDAQFAIGGKADRYRVQLSVLPLARQVLAEPERAQCAATAANVPATWLAACGKSGRRVLLHLLERSPISGVAALPEFFGSCEESNRRLLLEELARSNASGLLVGRDLLRASAMSGELALPRELVECEVTGALVLPAELVLSDVSAQKFRADQAVTSAVSGKTGHDSEFKTCGVSGQRILPEEGATSSISGTFARNDLLVESEKSGRKGLVGETVKCSTSGKVLLTDEAVASVVSGAWVDRDLCDASAVTGRPALAEELVRCEITGAKLLPEESGRSEASGRCVDRRLLVASAVSGRLALREEFAECSISGVAMLPDELSTSDVSGRRFRTDEKVASAVSGRTGHRSEMVRCAVTNWWLLPEETGVSAVSGKRVRSDLLRPSTRPPHRLGLANELVCCDATGRELLVDEVARSAVSQRLVDQDLLVPSPVSGKRGLAEEMVMCQLTGKPILPTEAGYSEMSGRAGDARRLVRSQVSGRMLLDDEVVKCEATGASAATDELVVSAVTGKKVRRDQVIASSVSGKLAHQSELVLCESSKLWALPEETALSSVSGKRVRRDLLVASDKNPSRVGLADEFVACAVSGNRLLKDEAVASALSGRWVDRGIGKPSPVSGRVGLPTEFIICEESGVAILPDESEVCQASGKRVDRRLLGRSDISGNLALMRLLLVCPETMKRGFEAEMKKCATSGLLVAPDALERCSLTNDVVVKRLLVRCEVSGRRLMRDRAVRSDSSGRLGHPESTQRCVWTGQVLLSDEVHRCPVTNQWFSRAVPVTWAAAPLVWVTQDGVPALVPATDDAMRTKVLLESAGFKVRGLRILQSENQPVVAFLVDVSGMFGLRKKHLLGLATTGPGAKLLDGVTAGRLDADGWKTLGE